MIGVGVGVIFWLWTLPWKPVVKFLPKDVLDLELNSNVFFFLLNPSSLLIWFSDFYYAKSSHIHLHPLIILLSKYLYVILSPLH